MLEIIPTGEYIAIERDYEEKTAGGVFIPDNSSEKPVKGTVIAVGRGRLLHDGTFSPHAINVGDRVFYSQYAHRNKIKADNKEIFLVKFDEVYAVIKGE